MAAAVRFRVRFTPFPLILRRSFGTAGDLKDFKNNFANGWLCLGNSLDGTPRCEYSFMLAAIFAAAYSFTYIFGSKLMKVRQLCHCCESHPSPPRTLVPLR